MPSEYGLGKRFDTLIRLNPFSSMAQLAALLKADPATIRRLLRVPINGIGPHWTLLPILSQMAIQSAPTIVNVKQRKLTLALKISNRL
jgi:hypothetical protein